MTEAAPTPSNARFDWSDARIADLKTWKGEGSSHRTIALRFACSRDTVSGMVKRLGLPSVTPPPPLRGHVRAPRDYTELDAAIRKMREPGEGKTPMGQKAMALATNRSKNTIVDRMKAMGLSTDAPNGTKTGRKPRAPKPHVAEPQIVAPTHVELPAFAPTPAHLRTAPRPPTAETANPALPTLRELEAHQCSFPIGSVPRGQGEEQRFCGSMRERGRSTSYCTIHADLAESAEAKRQRLQRRQSRERAA